jgi:hypothetical protein
MNTIFRSIPKVEELPGSAVNTALHLKISYGGSWVAFQKTSKVIQL